MTMPGISLVNRRFPVGFIYEGRDRAAKGTGVSMGEYKYAQSSNLLGLHKFS